MTEWENYKRMIEEDMEESRLKILYCDERIPYRKTDDELLEEYAEYAVPDIRTITDIKQRIRCTIPSELLPYTDIQYNMAANKITITIDPIGVLIKYWRD